MHSANELFNGIIFAGTFVFCLCVELSVLSASCKYSSSARCADYLSPFIVLERLISLQKPYPGLTGRVEFNETGERNRFNLDVVELHKGIYYKIGSWDTHNGFAYTRSREHLKTILFEKLRNKTFIVSSKIGEPFLKYREAPDGEVLEGNDRYEGYSMDLIAGIAELLNISFRFELTPDGKYGAYNPDTKRWDGLVGQLLERVSNVSSVNYQIFT